MNSIEEQSISDLRTEMRGVSLSLKRLQKRLSVDVKSMARKLKDVENSIGMHALTEQALNAWDKSNATIVIAVLRSDYHPKVKIDRYAEVYESFIFPGDVTEGKINSVINERCEQYNSTSRPFTNSIMRNIKECYEYNNFHKVYPLDMSHLLNSPRKFILTYDIRTFCSEYTEEDVVNRKLIDYADAAGLLLYDDYDDSNKAVVEWRKDPVNTPRPTPMNLEEFGVPKMSWHMVSKTIYRKHENHYTHE